MDTSLGTIPAHDLAEDVASEHVRWCRQMDMTPLGALRAFSLKVPAPYRRLGWDDVRDAVAARWLEIAPR